MEYLEVRKNLGYWKNWNNEEYRESRYKNSVKRGGVGLRYKRPNDAVPHKTWCRVCLLFFFFNYIYNGQDNKYIYLKMSSTKCLLKLKKNIPTAKALYRPCFLLLWVVIINPIDCSSINLTCLYSIGNFSVSYYHLSNNYWFYLIPIYSTFLFPIQLIY